MVFRSIGSIPTRILDKDTMAKVKILKSDKARPGDGQTLVVGSLVLWYVQ